jgi:hypothetical protein
MDQIDSHLLYFHLKSFFYTRGFVSEYGQLYKATIILHKIDTSNFSLILNNGESYSKFILYLLIEFLQEFIKNLNMTYKKLYTIKV